VQVPEAFYNLGMSILSFNNDLYKFQSVLPNISVGVGMSSAICQNAKINGVVVREVILLWDFPINNFARVQEAQESILNKSLMISYIHSHAATSNYQYVIENS